MRSLIVFVVLAVVVVGVYGGVAAASGHSGYPLDDAWIHQTYARNWAETGELAYVAGQPSAGSTAPLWTFLISFAYRLQIDPYLWTLGLGAISLALSGWLLARLARRLFPARRSIAWAVGLACVLEWHMIWAAASGMETMLFIALALGVIDRLLADAPGWAMGLCGGLLTLTRPEGLLLIGLAAIGVLIRSIRGGPKQLLAMLVIGLIALAPGVWLNWRASGSLFPNTFYAKQQEYAEVLSNLSLWLRSVGDMLLAPFVGAQLLMIPGLISWIAAHRPRLRDRSRWLQLLPLIWIGAHGLVYSVRLPVAYQHGRYLMPIIPILLLYGIGGTFDWVMSIRWPRTVRTALLVSIGATLVAFVPIGATAYATDVDVIDNEMVRVARWLEAHAPPGALIAAHDIGAIGYFTRRPLLDLAGLISPEVIPFIRDEDRLLNIIQARGAKYVVTFPGWYPHLSQAPLLRAVFAGQSRFSPEHLTVYQVQ